MTSILKLVRSTGRGIAYVEVLVVHDDTTYRWKRMESRLYRW